MLLVRLTLCPTFDSCLSFCREMCELAEYLIDGSPASGGENCSTAEEGRAAAVHAWMDGGLWCKTLHFKETQRAPIG